MQISNIIYSHAVRPTLPVYCSAASSLYPPNNTERFADSASVCNDKGKDVTNDDDVTNNFGKPTIIFDPNWDCDRELVLRYKMLVRVGDVIIVAVVLFQRWQQ